MNKLVIWWNKAKFDAFRALLTGIISTRVALPKDAKYDFYSIAATEAGKNSGQRSLEETRELWGEATFLVPAGKRRPLLFTRRLFPHVSPLPPSQSEIGKSLTH